nr:hypothetical protein [uncultured Flavobacterium sp.]
MRTIILLLIAFLWMSCRSYFITNYKIVTQKRNYYTNNYSYVNDSIVFYETKRDGSPKCYYTIPFKGSEIIPAK